MDSLALARLLGQLPESNQDGYDNAGYIKKYGVPAPYNSLQDYQQATGMHLNDEFKMPNHPTFSNGSVYSQPDMPGGAWQRGGSEQSNLWNYQPSQTNLQNMSQEQLAQYFKERENTGTSVTLPNGQIIWGRR